VYLLEVNLSRLLQPFMRELTIGNFFRGLKAMCMSRVSRSGSRGSGGGSSRGVGRSRGKGGGRGIRSEREVAELQKKVKI
jgi:hypothetical protein